MGIALMVTGAAAGVYGVTVSDIEQIALFAAGAVQLILGIAFLSRNSQKAVSYETYSHGKIRIADDGLFMGRPYKVKKGVYYYRRQDLPNVAQLVRRAERAIVFVEVTGRGFFESLEAEGPEIAGTKKILAWLFPPGSEILERQAQEYEIPDLEMQAAKSLAILARVQSRIEKKENLEIRVLNSYLEHSMIITDPGDANSIIEVVEYSKKPMGEWKAKIIFNRSNPAEYWRYFLEYSKVIEDAAEE